jgi:hypothetical protein
MIPSFALRRLWPGPPLFTIGSWYYDFGTIQNVRTVDVGRLVQVKTTTGGKRSMMDGWSTSSGRARVRVPIRVAVL